MLAATTVEDEVWDCVSRSIQCATAMLSGASMETVTVFAHQSQELLRTVENFDQALVLEAVLRLGRCLVMLCQWADLEEVVWMGNSLMNSGVHHKRLVQVCGPFSSVALLSPFPAPRTE